MAFTSELVHAHAVQCSIRHPASYLYFVSCILSLSVLIDATKLLIESAQHIATSSYLLRIPSPATVRTRAPNPYSDPRRA